MDNEWQFADARTGPWFRFYFRLLSFLHAVRQIFPEYLLLLLSLLLLMLACGLESARRRRVLY
ncbi:MAG: hypothetical protein HY011_28545 [Acidobacteria bacterium]|nr:hypothetical protein [Acidobacteriota bacterium]